VRGRLIPFFHFLRDLHDFSFFEQWLKKTHQCYHSNKVVLDYNELMNANSNLSAQIAKAFGNKDACLGICFVKNVPTLPELREKLLISASKLASLGPDLVELEDKDSLYSFGWSHGKEIMNGKPDTAKGSFYNNPVFNTPPGITSEKQTLYPCYYNSNIWPKSMPELESEFMNVYIINKLAKLVIEVGQKVAFHCDKFLLETFPELPENFLVSMIKDSEIHKSRLLHYFPIDQKATEVTSDGENMDSWCGIHVDHSVLTVLIANKGLVSAMYVDESENGCQAVDRDDPEVKAVLKDSGLFIKDRFDKFTQVKIPENYIAFQIGEAATVASKGLLLATPHLVRGAAFPNMARNTFATFMQPNLDHILADGVTFGSYSAEMFQKHSAENK
jgi:isopenicillin N synthase-like dioxygenase